MQLAVRAAPVAEQDDIHSVASEGIQCPLQRGLASPVNVDQRDPLRNQALLENSRQIFPKARQMGVGDEAYFHAERAPVATRFREFQDRGKDWRTAS